MAFKGVSVSFTGLSPQEKKVEGERIKQMGGTVFSDFALEVDLLIAKNSETTPKYRGAFCWGKPVCHVRMIDALWKDESGRHVRDHVNEQRNDFKIPIFAGCVITISGVSKDDRDLFGKAIRQNGGTYARDMEKGVCTHLLTNKTSGDKYKFAQEWGGIRIVGSRWLRKCLERDMRVSEEYYHPDRSIRKAVSPPRHNAGDKEVFPDTGCRPIAQSLFSRPPSVCTEPSRITLVQNTPTKMRVASVDIKKPAFDDTIELGSSSDEDVLLYVSVKNENMTVAKEVMNLGMEVKEVTQEISQPEQPSFVLNQAFADGSGEAVEMDGLKSDSVQSVDVSEMPTHVSKLTTIESQTTTMESTLHDKTISAMEKRIEALDLHVSEHTYDRTQSSGGLPESTSTAEGRLENTFSVQNATCVIDPQFTADQTRPSDGHIAIAKTELEAPTSNTCLSSQTSNLKRSSAQNSTSSLKCSSIMNSAQNMDIDVIEIETSKAVFGSKNVFGRDQSGDFNAAISSDALDCSMRQMLWAIYEKGIDSDVIVQAGGKEYKVLRGILISQSEIFKGELLSDSEHMALKTVEIKGITEQAADAFVRFLYLGVVERGGPIEELLVLASRYKVKSLQERCSDHLVAELNEDNAPQYLVLAISLCDARLKDRILTYIKALSLIPLLKVFESKPWRDYLNGCPL